MTDTSTSEISLSTAEEVAEKLDAAGLRLDIPPDTARLIVQTLRRLAEGRPVPMSEVAELASDLKNPEALKEFYIGNSRRLSMAGKILFPVPNRRLSKRLYRLTAPTLLVWGKSDALIPPVYAEQFKKQIASAEIVEIEQAGHMLPYEQPEAFVRSVTAFLN